jgi:S1-C subfamily serine protease
MSETTPIATYFIRVRGRILGPYDIGQLKVLRGRGQFSRANEVSVDRQTWQSAAAIEDLLATKTPIDVRQSGSEPRQSAAPATPSSGSSWYYSVGSERRGPLSTAEMKALLESEQVNSGDLVWREGLREWVAISTVPELTSVYSPDMKAAQPARKPSHWRAIVLSTTIVALLAGIGLFELNRRSLLPALPMTRFFGSGAITTVEGDAAEQQLAKSVGFVVCGFRGVLKDGTLVEEVSSTGTCFSVSRDGYALTNKHVIEKIEQLTRATLLFDQLKKEQSIDIEPRVWVFFGPKVYNARIVSTSENFDLGVLKIERQSDSYFRLAATDSGLRGQKVYALGFPALAQTPLSNEEIAERWRREVSDLKGRTIKVSFKPRDLEFSLTVGAVSRITKESEGRIWIQHNADINPGNSGGPLITSDGVVHGINTLGVAGGEANGIFFSLTTGQLREEIDQHVPSIEWK